MRSVRQLRCFQGVNRTGAYCMRRFLKGNVPPSDPSSDTQPPDFTSDGTLSQRDRLSGTGRQGLVFSIRNINVMIERYDEDPTVVSGGGSVGKTRVQDRIDDFLGVEV